MTRQIRLLGTLEIEENGRPAPMMKYSKGCALLVYLIVTGQTHGREAVADLLWEASSTIQSLRNLRKLLHQIRPFVPELVITRKQLFYQADNSVEIDFLTLQKAFATQDVLQLDKALTHYRGELLDGFYLDDAPRFGEWLMLAREQLRQQVWDGYRRLCAVYEEEQAWDKGIHAARRWLALDTLDEEIHRVLIRFLAANEQVEAALAQYESCRRLLWKELGVGPEAATTAVAAQLKQLTLPAAGELTQPGALPPNSYLPYQRNMTFTGRSSYLLHLAEVLLPSHESKGSLTKTAVITGMGGLGKTQLAVEYAYRYGRFYPGGVYWMSFADGNNVADEVAAIGGEQGLALYREADHLTVADQVGRVRRAWQQPIPRLLIFDKCEEEGLLAQWRPVTGGCRVLLTSRRTHWSPELQVSECALPVLEPSESVGLLQQLTPELNSTDAAKIASELGHLPLALHLAGGFLHRYQQISADQYLSQLRQSGPMQHPSLQGRGLRHSPTGHALNVSRTFAINLDQLDPSDAANHMARKLMARAACFAPGEPIPRKLLLSTVITDGENIPALLLSEDGLARLIALGFLDGSAGKTVVMHRLLVYFTLERIDDHSDSQLAVIKTVEGVLESHVEHFSYLGTMPLPSSHVKHIVSNALNREMSEAIRLSNLWSRHLRDNARYVQAEQISRQAYKICEMKLGLHHPDTADTLCSLGVIEMFQGAYQKARPLLERCLAIREALYHPNPNHPDIAESLNSLGMLLNLLGEYEAARPYLARVLKSWQEKYGPDHPRVAIALNNLGTLLTELGEYAQAEQYLDQAYNIWVATNGPEHPLTAHAISNIGLLLMKKGALKQAQPFLEQALATRERLLGSHHPSTSESMRILGIFLMKSGRYQQAQPYLKKALSLQKAVRPANHPILAYYHMALGEWYQVTNQNEIARKQFTLARTIFEHSGILNHPEFHRVQRNLQTLRRMQKPHPDGFRAGS